MLRLFASVTVLSATAAALLAACEDPFPAENTRVYGTFGAEVYDILKNEFLWSGTQAEGEARAGAFTTHKDDVVWALDTLATGKVRDGMLPLLDKFLPLYDDKADGTAGAIPSLTRDTAKILDKLVADRPALEAMAAMGAAVEANPGATTHLLGTLARHPIQLLDPMIDMTLDLEPELTEVFRWLHRELPAKEEKYVVRSDEKTFMQRLLDVNIDVTTEPIGPVTLSARLDGRGAPVVMKLPNGQYPAPFVDQDGDGLVDIDAYARPVDAGGTPIDMPTFAHAPTAGEERDQLGRAIVHDAQGAAQLVYDYFDLRQSVIAYLMRDGRKLMADGVQYDLFTAFDALLGGRVTRSDADGSYTGFDVEHAPFLDLMFALNELRRYDRLVPLIRVLEFLSQDREPLLRQLVVDMAKTRRIMHDAPSLAANNTMFEDVHPVLSDMAKAGVLRDLFAASKDPRSATLFDGLKTMMKYTGLTPTDMTLLQTSSDVDAMQFVNPTPWDEIDTDDSQRSWLQKGTLLMAETTHVPVIMRFLDRVDVPEVQITPDMAQFYVDAIAGVCKLDLGDEFLENLAVQIVAEFDDTDLSAEELNLFLNHDQTAVGNPIGKSGQQVRKTYGQALLAMQTSKSLYSLQPWAERMVAKGQGETFIRLFAVLAAHYSETAYETPGFKSYGTGFRRMEPYLVKVFDETDLDEHLMDLQVWSDSATVDVGGETVNVADELDRFLRWMLDTDAGVVLRNGLTSIPSRKGGTIDRPSRLQILMNAFDEINAALNDAPEAKAAWDRVDLLGIFLDMNDAGTELENPHALEVLVKLLPILSDEAAQAVSEPDWQESIANFVNDLSDAMGSRGFTALVDSVRKIRDTPRHKAFLDGMLAAMFQEEPDGPDTDLFGATLQLLATTGQMRIPFDAGTRMLRFVGNILDPADRLVFKPMETLKAMRALDPDRVTSELAKNLLVEPEVGYTPLGALGDSFKAGLRPTPGATGVFSADDLFTVFSKMRDWMNDGERGAERLYKVIKNR
ncbi:MAG: hypothetical protein U1F43_36220 [Myxococcota bacterium]